MNPELVQTIVAAALVAWGAYTALRSTWARTRMGMLGGLATALLMILLVRLIATFGGWTDWFIYVWFAVIAVCVFTTYRAVTVWPDLPWRAEDAKARRSEASGLGFSAVLALVVAGALVLPGLLLG